MKENQEQNPLTYEPQDISSARDETFHDQANEFCIGYKDFLSTAKTERKAVQYTVQRAEKQGFIPWNAGTPVSSGDKIYIVNRQKAVILAVIGSQPLEEGLHLISAHIDAPRLDLKMRPLYEDSSIALLKTQYYGGIKHYQWASVPLALYGTVVLQNGQTQDIVIGEDDDDCVFTITDLLPHLSAEQYKRPLHEGIAGEELNALFGSYAKKDSPEGQKVKHYVLDLLNKKYGMTERDFVTAEFELVPAGKARDVGLDRSMVGGYGQDDRVCSYTALQAALSCNAPKKTFIVVLCDKEEVGSMGNTGLSSFWLLQTLQNLCDAQKASINRTLAASFALSGDVSSAFDPTFASVYEKNNTALIGRGVTVTKYTGSRGKAGASDASAEIMATVCRCFDDNNIMWQPATLGKVDAGGGGTVALDLARLNMDVVDIGVAVLSMHSPFEVTSKLDVYSAYLAYLAFANR